VKARVGDRRTKTSLRQATGGNRKKPGPEPGIKDSGVAGAEQALLFGALAEGFQGSLKAIRKVDGESDQP
jgi:hypothetical protein